jgi:hypothetical protein
MHDTIQALLATVRLKPEKQINLLKKVNTEDIASAIKAALREMKPRLVPTRVVRKLLECAGPRAGLLLLPLGSACLVPQSAGTSPKQIPMAWPLPATLAAC